MSTSPFAVKLYTGEGKLAKGFYPVVLQIYIPSVVNTRIRLGLIRYCRKIWQDQTERNKV